MAENLPDPLPGFDATPDVLLAWASTATKQTIVGTWRPGHSEHAGLLFVRFDTGREIFFETINDATSPKRFFSAFIAVGGTSMPAYSEPQLRILVSALVRAAQLSDALDETDFWVDTGSTFLRACLTVGNTQTIELEGDSEAERRARYSAAVRYACRRAWPPRRGSTAERARRRRRR